MPTFGLLGAVFQPTNVDIILPVETCDSVYLVNKYRQHRLGYETTQPQVENPCTNIANWQSWFGEKMQNMFSLASSSQPGCSWNAANVDVVIRLVIRGKS